MYCIICRKHNMKSSTNKKDVFVRTPSTRFLNDSLKCHSASSVHTSAIQTELVQKMSYFHSEIVQKDKVEISLYEQVFATAFFIMKHFISNILLIPLLTFVEKTFDCSNLRFFAHKSQGSQREIFLTVGSTVMDSVLEKARKAATFGILTDEVADTNEEIKYIKQVETVLRQLWYFFDNSPKRLVAYLKTQTQLKKIKLGEKGQKCVATRLKKACRTRWLSLDASVRAVHKDDEAVMQTLNLFEKSDATASGLQKMRSINLLGSYIFSVKFCQFFQISPSFFREIH